MESIEELVKHFSGKNVIERKELFKYMKSFNPELKDTTFRWRIYKLKQQNIILSISRNTFKLVSNKKNYIPHIEKKLLNLCNIISKEFKDLQYCIWDSLWLNEFSIHQASKGIIILEIEKEMIQTVFYHLVDKKIKNLYLEPDKKTIELYVTENNDSVIIKQLISKSPVQKSETIPVPKLEKLIVDLFCDKEILNAYHGSEMITVIETALSKYEINYTTLMNYARRRKKEVELKSILLNNIEASREFLK